MTGISLNTLRLCRQLLGNQQVSVNADRKEVEAVFAARDELDAAILAAQDAQEEGALNGG